MHTDATEIVSDTANTAQDNDTEYLDNLQAAIIMSMCATGSQYNPVFNSSITKILKEQNPTDTQLSKVLIREIISARHLKHALMTMVSANNLPWSSEHGRLLSKTKFAGEIARYLYIPYPQKEIRRLLKVAITKTHDKYLVTGLTYVEFLVARLTDITSADFYEILWNGKSLDIMVATIKYHPTLCTPEMINECITLIMALRYPSVRYPLLMSVLDHISSGILTEATVILLYSLLTPNDESESNFFLYRRLSMLIPCCRSNALINSIAVDTTTGRVARRAFAAYCVNPSEYEMLAIISPFCVKEPFEVLSALSGNKNIHWTTKLGTTLLHVIQSSTKNYNHLLELLHSKGLCQDITEAAVESEEKQPADSASETQTDTQEMAVSSNIKLVSGSFSAVDSGNNHWEKKVSSAVEKGQRIITTVTGFGETETDILNGLSVMQNTLNAEYPNFKPVTQLLMGQLFACLIRKAPIRFQPMMLLGEPGIGKTSYAQHLSKLLGMSFKRIDMAGVTAGFTITGLNQSWHSGTPGLIAKAILVEDGVANPLFILDEVDKAGGDSRYNVGASLLTLLEEQTSRSFQDEFLEGVTFDLTYSTFFMTANRIDSMPDALLSRMLIVDVPQPTMDEKRDIAQRVYTKKLEERKLLHQFTPTLSENLVAELCGDSLRTMDRDLTLGISNALLRAGMNNRNGVIMLTTEDLHTNTKKAGIGFQY